MLIDVLRKIAEERNVPVAQVAINWTSQQKGITSVLVGAKNAKQAEINAGSGNWYLSQEELKQINEAYDKYIKDVID